MITFLLDKVLHFFEIMVQKDYLQYLFIDDSK